MSLLTDEEVAELTGYEQPAAQIRCLREHGIHPVIRRDGRPRVTWDAVTAAMLVTPVVEPNWAGIKRGRSTNKPWGAK